jgi:class 3 adenylate cyclase
MEAAPLERKLVAILAADVASYSRLMEVNEEGTLATLSAFRRRIFTQLRCLPTDDSA